MAAEDKKKVESPAPTKRLVHFPQIKTFTNSRGLFRRRKTNAELDAEVNEFLKEKGIKGQAPMPGKIYGTFTGEKIYVMAFTGKVEI